MTERSSGAGAGQRGGAPETLGAILPRVLRECGWTPRRRGSTPADVWARAAGEELAAETRAATLRKGVLTVEVRSAGLLAELSGFRGDELLSKVLAEEPTGRITGLRFRLGVF